MTSADQGDVCTWPSHARQSDRPVYLHYAVRLHVVTVNYRYNVIDGTLKKLRYIRFYVIPV